MKVYTKPELEVISFETEAITGPGVDGSGFGTGNEDDI